MGLSNWRLVYSIVVAGCPRAPTKGACNRLQYTAFSRRMCRHFVSQQRSGHFHPTLILRETNGFVLIHKRKRQFNACQRWPNQGRRAATRAGIFDEVLRSDQTNANPTEMATTGNLRSALGVAATGEAAARVVIGRMIQNRKARMAKTAMSKGGEDGSSGVTAGACAHGPIRKGVGRGGQTGGRSKAASRDRGGRGGSTGALKRKPVKGVSTPTGGVSGGLLGEGIFKTVLSSMAKKRLREGLHEIKSTPLDLLRRGFVEVEPAKHGSTALGCHLIKGWEEQKNGNKSRVSESWTKPSYLLE